jgi:hypothetical protein
LESAIEADGPPEQKLRAARALRLLRQALR